MTMATSPEFRERARDRRGRFCTSEPTARREALALQLRAQGLSYRSIAAEMGINATSAMRMVKRGLERVPVAAANELRALHLMRLEELYSQLEDRLHRPGCKPERALQLVDRMVAILAREAAMMGLDAPRKKAVDFVSDELLKRLIEEEKASILRLNDTIASFDARDTLVDEPGCEKPPPGDLAQHASDSCADR